MAHRFQMSCRDSVLTLEVIQIGLAGGNAPFLPGVEMCQLECQVSHVRCGDRPRFKPLVQHLVFRKPLHLDKPVDNAARAAKCKGSAFGHDKRNGAYVDITGQHSVKPHFLVADMPARLKAPKIEETQPHRFFHLEGPVVGQKDQSGVGLKHRDRAGRSRKGRRPTQKTDFLCKLQDRLSSLTMGPRNHLTDERRIA